MFEDTYILFPATPMHALDFVGWDRRAERVSVPGSLLHVPERHLLRQLLFTLTNILLVRLSTRVET